MRCLTLSAAILAALAGCDPGKDPALEPLLGTGKADVSSRVQDQGALDFAAPRTGSFDADLEFHGFHLAVRAGAVVTLDNTHLGSAAKLDSTLFVYGPRNAEGFGNAAIAFDDDSGWGRHARIRDLHLAEAGEYLVVLGTANGLGRGHYRLEARCESGACDPAPAPDSCHPGLASGIQHCIAAQIADGDLEGDYTMSYADALAVCTDGEALGGIFDELCAGSARPDFCDLDFESFYTTAVPPCSAALGERFGLCGEYLSEALALATTDLYFMSESDYPYEPVSWPSPAAPTAESVLALSGHDPLSAVSTTDFAHLFAWRGRPVDSDIDDDEANLVRRHRHLRRILEDNLTDTLVVRIGAIQIHVYVVGRTACGETAGVATISIET